MRDKGLSDRFQIKMPGDVRVATEARAGAFWRIGHTVQQLPYVRIPVSLARRSCAGCYRLPSPRRASQWAVMSYR